MAMAMTLAAYGRGETGGGMRRRTSPSRVVGASARERPVTLVRWIEAARHGSCSECPNSGGSTGGASPSGLLSLSLPVRGTSSVQSLMRARSREGRSQPPHPAPSPGAHGPAFPSAGPGHSRIALRELSRNPLPAFNAARIWRNIAQRCPRPRTSRTADRPRPMASA